MGPPRGAASRAKASVSNGVAVTLIDFTLSRAQVEGGERILFDAFDDECIFQGEGLYRCLFQAYFFLTLLEIFQEIYSLTSIGLCEITLAPTGRNTVPLRT